MAQIKSGTFSRTFAYLHHYTCILVTGEIRIGQLPGVVPTIDLAVGGTDPSRFDLQDKLTGTSARALDRLVRKPVTSVDCHSHHRFAHPSPS
jgi:hypothetical protein